MEEPEFHASQRAKKEKGKKTNGNENRYGNEEKRRRWPGCTAVGTMPAQPWFDPQLLINQHRGAYCNLSPQEVEAGG